MALSGSQKLRRLMAARPAQMGMTEECVRRDAEIVRQLTEGDMRALDDFDREWCRLALRCEFLYHRVLREVCGERV